MKMRWAWNVARIREISPKKSIVWKTGRVRIV